jgi:hypothetical protein
MARSDERWSNKPRHAYRDALAELIFVAFVCPIFGLISFTGIFSLRWHWDIGRFLPSRGYFFLIAGGFGCVLLFIGYRLFGSYYDKYLTDPSPSSQFNTARDRRIVAWQRFGMVASCGGLIPIVLSALALPAIGILVHHLREANI